MNIDSASDTIKVSFTLKNTGKYEGDEVAQLYVNIKELSLLLNYL